MIYYLVALFLVSRVGFLFVKGWPNRAIAIPTVHLATILICSFAIGVVAGFDGARMGATILMSMMVLFVCAIPIFLFDVLLNHWNRKATNRMSRH